MLMSEIDGESFLGILDIPKYPPSRDIITARSTNPWHMSPWESAIFDQVVPMLSNGWIYFGTYYVNERNLKLALE
jgi:hypothetical protein